MHAADSVIFGSMLVSSLLIGVYHAIKDRKSTKGTEGYLMAERSMTAIPAGISIAVTFQSSVTVLGFPGDVYTYGITLLWYCCAIILMFFAVSGIFIPIFYSLKISSLYEYLEKRFSKFVRLLSTTLYLLTNLFYMGANVYGPALTLRSATGLNLYAAISITSLICAIYTALGGLKGVIWADVLQGAVMVAGMLAVIIRGSVMQGGFGNIIEIASQGGRTTVNYSIDPRFRYTFWAMTIGQFVAWTAICGTNQSQVQRLLSAKSRKEAMKALAIGIGGICIFTTLAVACGLVAYSFFSECDPRLGGCVKRRDEIYPFAVSTMFQGIPGLDGLFLACVYSASLSTVSSGLNSMITVIMADLIKPFTRWSERIYTLVAKVATVVCGCAVLAMGIFASLSGDIVRLSIGGLSSFLGPSLAVFTLGIFCPFVNEWGAALGMICGCSMGMTMFMGSMGLQRLDHLSGFLNVSATSCPINCDFDPSANTTFITIPHSTNSSSVGHFQGIENLYAVSVYYLAVATFLCTAAVAVITSLITGGWKQRHGVSETLIMRPFKSNTSIDNKNCEIGGGVIANTAVIVEQSEKM